MADQRANLLRLRIQISEREAKEAARLVDDIRQELTDLARVEQLNTRIADAYENAVKQQNSALRSTINTYDDAANAARRYADTELTAQQKIYRARLLNGSGGRGGSLDTVDRAGAIGSQIAGGLGASGSIGNAAGLLGDIAGGVATFGAAGGALAVVLGVATAATNVYTKALQDNAERAQTYAGALAQAFEAGNRAQIQAMIQQQQDQIVALEATARVLRDRAEAARQQLAISLDNASSDLTNWLNQAAVSIGLEDGVNPALRDTGMSAEALQGELDKVNQQIELANLTLDAYRLVLEQTTQQTNEAADAQERLSGFIEAIKAAGRAIYDEAQMLLRIDDMDVSQRRTRAAEITREIALLEQQKQDALAQGTDAGGYAAYLLGQQISTLRNEFNLLADTSNTTADAITNAKAAMTALSTQTDNYFKALEAEVKAQEALFSAQERQRTEYEKYIADGLKISVEAQEQLDKIIEESGERQADIVRKAQDQIAKIERDYGRDRANAVAERDALAAYQASIRAKDQLDDARKAESDQLKEQEKAQERSIRSLQDNIRKQAAALDAGYRAQQQITTAAINRAQVDLVNAKNQEAMIAMYGAGTQRNIMTSMWGDLSMIATNYAQSLVSSVGFILGAGMGQYSAYTQYPPAVGGQQPGIGAGAFDRMFDRRYSQYARAAQVTR